VIAPSFYKLLIRHTAPYVFTPLYSQVSHRSQLEYINIYIALHGGDRVKTISQREQPTNPSAPEAD
jgi:hypothetical protein